MPVSEEVRMPRRRRPPVVVFIIPLFIGLLGLYRVMESPHFESYRTVDVVQLLASGAGFGVALTGSMFILLRPNESPETS
jgi:hypothetical protein